MGEKIAPITQPWPAELVIPDVVAYLSRNGLSIARKKENSHVLRSLIIYSNA
jgi:hypothetical protein